MTFLKIVGECSAMFGTSSAGQCHAVKAFNSRVLPCASNYGVLEDCMNTTPQRQFNLLCG